MTGVFFIVVILVFRQGIVGTIEHPARSRRTPSQATGPNVETIEKAASTPR